MLGKPVFSYIVEDAEGKYQTEARIRVSVNADMKDFIHDTGFTPDIDSLAYTADITLKPGTRYYWDATVHTDAGEEAVSEANWFETGKLDELWNAKWITCDSAEPRHPIFFKNIDVDNPVKTARIYICGLGLYELYINGGKISDEFLAPYFNNYNGWLQYQTFDVTEQVSGGGKLEVYLGNGWYKGRFGFDKPQNREGFYSDTWKLIAELRITHDDGSETIIGTDESWQMRRGQITFSNIYDGEVFDATLPETEAVGATLCTETLAPLTERLSTPVTIRENIKPVELIHTPAGETVLDLGQNFAGIFSLRVNEPKGARVHLQFGEVLQNGNFYRENLRTAKAEYIYISDDRERTIQPRFTFYGYRYVKVEGIANLRKEDFTGLALYSDIPRTGSIKTGSELVNRLILNTEWGQKSNFIDIPTDCPQRDERMGWTGDAQVFSPTACYQTDSYAFFRKYLYDMFTEQSELDGEVPYTVPSIGSRGTTAAGGSTSAVWGDAACIIPWNLYMFYGDKSVLAEQFESMKAWVDAITRIDGDNNGWRGQFHFADWLALDNPAGGDDQVIGGTDSGFIASVYYAYSTRLVSKAAEGLGNAGDSEKYGKLADKVIQDVRDEYYSKTGRPCINTQTGLLLTLFFNITDNPQCIRDELLFKFAANKNKLQTGFTGTPLLCNILSDNGMSDLAYKLLLNEDYPGWLYSVKLGATTIWERWNSLNPDGSVSSTGMNSFNHYANGSIVEWLYRHAAGISAEAPGFRKVKLNPIPNYQLRSLDAEYRSAAGTYKSAWKVLDAEHLELQITVPFGCAAELTLPFSDEEAKLLTAGEYTFSYKTNAPLRKPLSTSSTIRELLYNPKAHKLLKEYNPQIINVPEYMQDSSLRHMAMRFSDSPETIAQLDALDRALFDL